MGSKVIGTAIAIAAVGIAAFFVVNRYGGMVENVPGPVTGGSPLVYKVTGSFEGVYSFRGDSNAKIGGGCLIFQEVGTAHPCRSEVDCSVGGIGYCIPKEGEEDSDKGTCWFRPNPRDDHCQTKVTLPGKYSLGPANPFPHGTDHVFWRVLTCQGLKPPGCDGGIKDVHKRYRYGPKKEFKDKPKLYPEEPSKQPSGEQ